MEFVHFDDREPVPFPAGDGEFRAAFQPHLRDDLRSIEITQPEGAGFQVDGYEVPGSDGDFGSASTPARDLSSTALVTKTKATSGRYCTEPIAEMVVPYADPDRPYQSPLDIGEFNPGTMTNSLMLGCDCLGLIRYFDVAYVAPDGSGEYPERNLSTRGRRWHALEAHGLPHGRCQREVRRSRRLVVSSVATVGNYDYGFFWYFYQDGTIAVEIKATGIVATKAFAEGDYPEYGER